jgi:hypothetical protein
MALKETLVALSEAAIAEEKLEGSAEAASNLFAVTELCEARATKGLRGAAFPEPTDRAEFLTKGAALSLQETLQAEGLDVRVIPYKDIYFYLDIHW